MIFQHTKWVLFAINLVYIATGCAQRNPEISTGYLQLVANGEAFIHEGLVTKDGWELEFERVTLNLDAVVASQRGAIAPGDHQNTQQESKTVILVDDPVVVNLTEGKAGAVTVVTRDAVPTGAYNAIAWQLVSQPDTPAIQLLGIARKNDTTLNFQLQFDHSLTYLCGEYVGDQRKGLVKVAETGELEVTTHWDHLFGNGRAAPHEDINIQALGFTPIAAFEDEGTVKITYSELMQKLSPDHAELLNKTLQGLGHVGEGHCDHPPASLQGNQTEG